MSSIVYSFTALSPFRKSYLRSICMLLSVLLLLMFTTAGVYMIAVIKSPVKMDSLFTDSPDTGSTDYPPILHQIWLNYMNIPQEWVRSRKYNIGMNPNMTHMLWSSKEIEEFLSREYPWFLDTYLAYPYFNQKVNSARYFIIYHYGGVYMDMDFIVSLSFTEIYKKHGISQYECVFPQTWPSGVSNALFACRKKSRFMKFMTMNLQNSNRWLIVPYATTMWSGGPRFVSKCLGSYPYQETIYKLPMHYFTDVYFTHLHGGTWHRWDAQLIKMIYHLFSSKIFLMILTVMGFLCIYSWYRFRYQLNGKTVVKLQSNHNEKQWIA